jgi:hypothetical protein
VNWSSCSSSQLASLLDPGDSFLGVKERIKIKNNKKINKLKEGFAFKNTKSKILKSFKKFALS